MRGGPYRRRPLIGFTVSAKVPARRWEQNLEYQHALDLHDGSSCDRRMRCRVRLEFDAVDLHSGHRVRRGRSSGRRPSRRPPSGTVMLSWDPQTKNVTAKLQMVGFTPGSSHAMHIHQGSCAAQGDVLVPFPDVTANDGGAIDTTVTSSQPSAAGLAAGTFLNIHLAPAAQLGAPGSLGYTPISCADITPAESTAVTMARAATARPAPSGFGEVDLRSREEDAVGRCHRERPRRRQRPRGTYPPRFVRLSRGGQVPAQRSGCLAHW